LFKSFSDGVDWLTLTREFSVGVSVGLSLSGYNQSFDLNETTINMLSSRGISVGFDLYHDEYLEIVA
jgi:hypothetical protein